MDIPRNWRLRDQRYRLQGTVCNSCENKYFPPRAICPSCKSTEMETAEFSERGTIYSFSTVYQSSSKFAQFVPYVVALVDLDDGPRVTAQLTDVSPGEVEIGMPVQKVVRKISEEGERGMIVYGYKFRPLL